MDIPTEMNRASIACLFVGLYAFLRAEFGVSVLAVVFLAMAGIFLLVRLYVERARAKRRAA